MLTVNAFGTQWKRPRHESPLPEGVTAKFDWSSRLSLEMIRNHTKTDDVPGVTDEQLRLYRAASIEAAELYTGFLLSGQQTITEPIEGPATVKPGKEFYKYRLRYPVADGIVYLYGAFHPNENRPFHVTPGSRNIKVPIRTGLVDVSNCCDPCSRNAMNQGMLAAYKAGFACPDDVPDGIVLGCLQYIAWCIQHPGDEIVTQRNRMDARAGGSSGTNNIAVASGALETWRVFDQEL